MTSSGLEALESPFQSHTTDYSPVFSGWVILLMSKLMFMCKIGREPLSGSRTSTWPKQKLGVMWNFVYTHCGFVHLFTLYTSGDALKMKEATVMHWKKLWPKLKSGTTTLSEKRSESGCEVRLLKSNQDIRLRMYHEMFAQKYTKGGFGDAFLWSSKPLQHFEFPPKCVFFYFAGSKQHLRECQPWGRHHSRFPWCLRETCYFCCLLLIVPSCICLLLCFVTTHVIDLFAHCCSSDLVSHMRKRERERKRQVMRPHLWASTMCSSRRHSDVTVGFCVRVCITLSGLAKVLWVCLHPLLREYVCWMHLCVCKFPTLLFLSFFLPLSGCLCVSALNEYSHRINNPHDKTITIKHICDAYRAESKRW